MINILIVCNKKDYFLAKICAASVRYYYPTISIYLLKDELNGEFDTSEMEKHWNVEPLSYPHKKFGWSAAKMFFYTDPRFKGQKFLVLDADIVFAGKILDEPWLTNFEEGVIVSHQDILNPEEAWITNTFFNVRKMEQDFPAYKFPGFVFNGGQMFCEVGFVSRETLSDYFNFDKYPFWKRLDILPFVDQSLLNFLFPVLEQQKKLVWQHKNYMLWSEDAKTQQLDIEKIRQGNSYPFLIHWAGALRVPYIYKMTRPDILLQFENYYYSKIPLGYSKQKTRHLVASLDFHLRKSYRYIKKKIKS